MEERIRASKPASVVCRRLACAAGILAVVLLGGWQGVDSPRGDALTIYGPAREPRITMSVRQDMPAITLYRKDKSPGLVLTVMDDGRPAILFFDGKGKSRLDIVAGDDGGVILFSDGMGRKRMQVATMTDGRSRVATLDDEGQAIQSWP